MSRFGDTVVVVTGGAGGIGRAAVRAFSAEGARVVALDKVPVREVPGAALTLALDLAVEDEVRRGVDEVVRRFGKIDVLFNNCGVGANLDEQLGRRVVMRGALDVTEDDFDSVVASNLKSAVWLTKHAAPHLPKSEASCIISSSSVWARGRLPGALAYTASKAALSSVTLSWAYELAPVRAIALVLGAIDTPMFRANPLSTEDGASGAPTRRPGRPEEVADAVLFAAGCYYLNATEIVLDGGGRQ